MIWQKSDLDPDRVKEISKQYDVDLLTASILLRRQYTDPQSLRFLLERDPIFLHNPFLFEDMSRAVDRINRAIGSGEKILIFGDRDVDGITSTVLLLQTLKQMGAQVDWQLPTGEEDYGLTRQVIEKLVQDRVSLLISVDCGISNLEEIGQAAEGNLDTIVVDHHNPQDQLPAALAIINPKVEGSRYPFRDLSGCGVAAKLVWALFYSRTKLYGQETWLVHLQPENETISISAARLVNLNPEERLFESLVPGLASVEQSRVLSRLKGNTVLVFDESLQRRHLDKIGITDIQLQDIAFGDIRPAVESAYPKLKDRSLLWIREHSRMNRYSSPGELEILIKLYTTLQLNTEPGLVKTHQAIMDLVALGTIADLMPLVDENRIFVKQGLEAMGRMERSGLRELLIRQNLHSRRITCQDIAWQISPVLNSAGRLGQPETAAQIFLAEKIDDIEALIGKIIELNRKRKNLGEKIWGSCLIEGGRSMEKTDGKFVLVQGESIHRGITGIVAARLVNYYKVPAIVISVGKEKVVGSLRSPYSLDGFLDLFADLLLNYGGHDCAAGFSLTHEAIPQFTARFFLTAADHQPPEAGDQVLVVDAEIPPAYLNPDLIKVVEFFEPYGEGSPPLHFLTRGLRIEQIDIIGRREAAHLKLLLGAHNYKWPALYWNAAEKAGKDFSLNDTVDVVYRMARNYFQNTETLQLTILDLQVQ